MWVIDMVCLHNMNLIAIASTDQKIGESLTAPQACRQPLEGVRLRLGTRHRANCGRGLEPSGGAVAGKQRLRVVSRGPPRPGTWAWAPCMPSPSVSPPEFFDISNHNCARAFTFTDLDSCVLTIDYW